MKILYFNLNAKILKINKFKILKLIILFCFIANQIIYSSNFPITIKIVFPYFHPDTVKIGGAFTSWNFKSMTKITDSIYQYNAGSLVSNSDYIFYAGFILYPYNDSNYYYVSTSYKNLSRILYSKVYINDQLINSSYVWGDNNIHFTINNDGSISPSNNPINQTIDDRIPPEVDWPYADIHIPNEVPDSNETQISGWVQVLNDNNYLDTSKIEVDYIRLHARIGNQDTVLDADDYNTFDTTMNKEGGLYIRYPFFPHGFDYHTTMPAIAVNGYLTFNPSSIPDSVWHFWNPKYPRVKTISNYYTSYWFEVRYRITGKACIQVGIDFRDSRDSVSEGAVSNWGFESYDGLFHTLIVDTKHSTPNLLSKNGFSIPKDFSLYQNYPNPFNPATTINYSVPKTGLITINVYDMLGREVTTLVNEEKPAGNYSVNFNASKLASGVYIYRMQAGGFVDMKKLILLK